jgi:hypothetical protein
VLVPRGRAASLLGVVGGVNPALCFGVRRAVRASTHPTITDSGYRLGHVVLAPGTGLQRGLGNGDRWRQWGESGAVLLLEAPLIPLRDGE